MIRAIDRFYAKHPRVALGVAIFVAFACMCLAHAWDESDSSALRLQMMSSSARTV